MCVTVIILLCVYLLYNHENCGGYLQERCEFFHVRTTYIEMNNNRINCLESKLCTLLNVKIFVSESYFPQGKEIDNFASQWLQMGHIDMCNGILDLS